MGCLMPLLIIPWIVGWGIWAVCTTIVEASRRTQCTICGYGYQPEIARKDFELHRQQEQQHACGYGPSTPEVERTPVAVDPSQVRRVWRDVQVLEAARRLDHPPAAPPPTAKRPPPR